MYSWLPNAVDEKAHIVTASRRLARELQSAYNEAQLAAGKSSWLTPVILAWPDWLATVIQQAGNLATRPRRLDNISAAMLWKKCLARHLAKEPMRSAGLAGQSFKAWELVCDWSVALEAVHHSAGTEEERLFARTAVDYQKALRGHRWIDGPGNSRFVLDLILRDELAIPEKLVLAGFDRLVPVATEMLNALKGRGCSVHVLPAAAGGQTVSKATFDDAVAELRGAGAWARQVLESEPSARVAVVCPSLEANADRAHRLLLEGLSPGWQRGDNRYRETVNVSYGRKLSEYSAVHIALLILNWFVSGLTSREISQVLRSRCIGYGDIEGRCKLEFLFRRLPDRRWMPDEFVQAITGQVDSADVDRFVEALEATLLLWSSLPRSSGAAATGEQFDRLLETMQWPGTEALSSDEFQLINRWRNLLNEFAVSEIVSGPIDHLTALHQLTLLAGETIYQAQSGAGAVQLLGTLEAAGMEFDALWICGLDAANWPTPGQPTPFLARSLQRALKMPDSSPGDSLEFARRTLNRLRVSAPRCVMSWARVRDETDMMASPLLDEIATDVYTGPPDPGWYALQYLSESGTSVRKDDPVPAVAEDEKLRGGAYTIQLQSIEPLEAFASGRLGVRNRDSFETGLSPAVRGTLMHEALHNLYAERPSRQDLASWTAADLQKRSGSAIDAAFGKLSIFENETLSEILRLERARLQHIIESFHQIELERSNFSVEAVEAGIDYQRGSVRLALRVDRLDRLADDTLLIIDYKTGTPRNFLNADKKPADLQLPLYADAIAGSVGGLTLINIDSRGIGYKGAGGSIEWDGLKGASWSDQLSAWRHEVHRNVDEFAAGDVRVNLLRSAADARALQILSRREEFRRGKHS